MGSPPPASKHLSWIVDVDTYVHSNQEDADPRKDGEEGEDVNDNPSSDNGTARQDDSESLHVS
jgi:hypothetical protein